MELPADDATADQAPAAPDGPGAGHGALMGDVHARIRARVISRPRCAGRQSVMRTTFTSSPRPHLLAGNSLGQAAAAARRALAADPIRRIGAVAVALQDWAVPIVYEAAPLALLRTPERAAPLVKLSSRQHPLL